MIDIYKAKICVIGLGYVGLPLALLLAKQFNVVGFDKDYTRIKELKSNFDRTNEIPANEIKCANRLRFSDDKNEIKSANVYIVTVPTPVDRQNMPDLSPLINVCELIAGVLSKDDLVVFESTVFPGATEEVCVPILEMRSGLKYNVDFFCGYSPERINPGDKVNKIQNIVKVTSGSTPETATAVNAIYSKVVSAGTYRAPSIRVAEAAKVIENTQRDLNIALVNEFAQLFDTLSLDTKEVLDAAGSKWNFMPFTPGLVGGHCIGVDPYYLAYKAQSAGYQPELILTARRLNDRMGKFISTKLIKEMVRRKIEISEAKVLLLGLTFKENCSDLRNTKVYDVYKELKDYSCKIDLHDPIADKSEIQSLFGKLSISEINRDEYDAIVICVPHIQYQRLGLKRIKSFGKEKCLIFDVKSIFNAENSVLRL